MLLVIGHLREILGPKIVLPADFSANSTFQEPELDNSISNFCWLLIVSAHPHDWAFANESTDLVKPFLFAKTSELFGRKTRVRREP